jgi:hypothetical protein
MTRKSQEPDARTGKPVPRYDPNSERAVRFCELYVLHGVGARAAAEAGFSAKTAKAAAYDLLQIPAIQARIAALQAQLSTRTQVDAEYVIGNLREIVERSMQRAPVMMRRGKEMVQLQDEAGRDVWRFDARGAVDALGLLGKHLGLFASDAPPAPPGPVMINVNIVKVERGRE